MEILSDVRKRGNALRFRPLPIRCSSPPGLPTGEKLCGLKVYKGAAAVQLPSAISVLTSGKFMSLNLDCGDKIPQQKFNIEDTDGLDNWSRQRVRLRTK